MNKQTIEQIEESIKSLEELKKTLESSANIGQLEKEDEMWKPEEMEDYHIVNPTGGIGLITWLNSGNDKGCLEMGNVFKTKEEAEKYKLRLQSMAYKPFLPKDGEWYWYSASSSFSDDSWDSFDANWSGGSFGMATYLLGRIRRTKEEAEEWITKFSSSWSL